MYISPLLSELHLCKAIKRKRIMYLKNIYSCKEKIRLPDCPPENMDMRKIFGNRLQKL